MASREAQTSWKRVAAQSIHMIAVLDATPRDAIRGDGWSAVGAASIGQSALCTCSAGPSRRRQLTAPGDEYRPELLMNFIFMRLHVRTLPLCRVLADRWGCTLTGKAATSNGGDRDVLSRITSCQPITCMDRLRDTTTPCPEADSMAVGKVSIHLTPQKMLRTGSHTSNG